LRVAVKTVVLRRNRRALCKRRQSCEFPRLNAHAAEFDEAVKEYGELVELPSKLLEGQEGLALILNSASASTGKRARFAQVTHLVGKPERQKEGEITKCAAGTL
jgi:hypothetical protein